VLADPGAEPLVLVVTWLARPGTEDRVEGILRAMVPLSRAEPGCLQYSAHRSSEDRRLFMIFEVYRDEAALKAHEASDHFRRHVLEDGLQLVERRVRSFYSPL
jgi:quinol monooxygenase YgiN